MSALHFTREAFMFITGLVLFYTYYHKPFTANSFWLKRFKLICIPYIAWTALYILFTGTYLNNFNWAPQSLLAKFGTALATGNQFFMYYLLLTMQLYIVFPFMVKALKRWERAHNWILAGSFLVEIGLMALNQFVLRELNVASLPDWLGAFLQFRDRFIFTYQFWFIAGAIFAIHYEKIKTLLIKHTRTVVTSFLLMLAILWLHFAFDRIYLHEPEALAVLVLQPVMVPYSLMMALLLWRCGVKWSPFGSQSNPGFITRLNFSQVLHSESSSLTRL